MKNCVSCLVVVIFFVSSCLQQQQKTHTDKQTIEKLFLKRGQVISCGPDDARYGVVAFAFTGDENIKADFNLGIKLLHSFEYDDAEKAFAKVLDKDPDCAMAYWGIAMSNFHPLWAPPTAEELRKGTAVIQLGRAFAETRREKDYMNAIASFYSDWEKTDHHTRTLRFEQNMERVYKGYPDDKEAAVFYALSLVAASDPADKSFQKQKKAGSILESLYPGQPEHPGIVHYLIHTYDSPQLASSGLIAARRYAFVAPSSAHALHMPSHIFTRLGLWDECIASNRASVNSAKCYAEASGIKGHWDEELHGLDYLVYAYLQKGQKDSAKMEWDYLKTMQEVHPVSPKVAYAFAAIPARNVLENKLWKEAAALPIAPQFVQWEKHPWEQAIFHFARLLGHVHTGNMTAANSELSELARLHAMLQAAKDDYKANQVAIQMKAGSAWIACKEKKYDEALAAMQEAANMEDATEKSPVTPAEVLPARELLADMLMELRQPDEALAMYKAVLQKQPNRFNAQKGLQMATSQKYK